MATQQQQVLTFSVAGIGLLLGALLLAGLLVPTLVTDTGPPEPLVTVECGEIQGNYDSELEGYEFKGVPYAAPPTENRRWQAPQKMSDSDGTCWTGTHNATDYRPICSQIDFGTYEFAGSEDCLFLDIYTPSLKEKKPVLVYIHGGSLIGGNSHAPNYSPTLKLAKDMDVVFVSIQYRLGPLGFLVLDELTGRTGNYGLLDAVQSLKWIQENIEKFGGDPENVGVFGHSSGGTLIYGLMVTDEAKGLFHQAWISSASPVLRGTSEEAARRNSFIVDRAGCGNASIPAQCLMELDPAVITWAAYPEWGQSQIYGLPNEGVFDTPLLVIDGQVLRAGFRESFQRNLGSVPDVPLMIGTTAQEVEFGPDLPESTPMSLSEWTREIFQSQVRSSLSSFRSNYPRQVLNLYNDTDVTLAFTSLVTDLRVVCPNDVVARAAADALSSPVYQYVVTQRPSTPAFGLMNYAFHTWDLFAFFDAMDVILFGAASADDYKLVKIMQTQMRSFLTTGRPANLRWQTVEVNTAIIDKNITVVSRYNERKCNFWNNNGFFEYASVN